MSAWETLDFDNLPSDILVDGAWEVWLNWQEDRHLCKGKAVDTIREAIYLRRPVKVRRSRVHQNRVAAEWHREQVERCMSTLPSFMPDDRVIGAITNMWEYLKLSGLLPDIEPSDRI